MKARWLVIVCTCLFVRVLAQDDAPTKPDEILFDKAAKQFESSDYLTAAVTFEQVMKQFPKSPLVGRAHFNMALCYNLFKDYETAKKIFLEILNEKYDERDPNDLMEPYALYKHHACRYLAEMSLTEKNYGDAEKYIEMFDKKYPYQHFCGNEWSAYHMYVAVMRARVYQGTNQVKKALDVLLPYIFSDALASNEEVLQELEDILLKYYALEGTRAEFNRALASLKVRKTKNNTSGTIQLYGVNVEVEAYFFEDEGGNTLTEEERYRQKVVNNPLFKKFL